MYPFERYMKKLKNYVRNKAKPEGSIAKGYVADEALTFYSPYFRDHYAKRLPINDSRGTTTSVNLVDDNDFVHEEDDVPYDLADSDNEVRADDDVDDEVNIDHVYYKR
ncbi:hypothetical protein Tco_0247863 [Tanacetum coccineum]